MLQHRCPNCGCAEEEAAAALPLPLRVQMRLLRTARVIAVSAVLLLLAVLAMLVLLMFGPRVTLRPGKEPESLLSLPEALSEKLQSDQDFSYPSALLTISEQTSLSSPKWKSGNGNSYNRGMSISEENLIVPTKGIYRLYVQVTYDFDYNSYQQYKGSKEDVCVDDLMSLRISVQRLSKSYEQYRDLLVSEDTMSCTHDWTKSMSTAGTFELEAGTKLRVELNHRDHVIDDDTATFFGVERVSLK